MDVVVAGRNVRACFRPRTGLLDSPGALDQQSVVSRETLTRGAQSPRDGPRIARPYFPTFPTGDERLPSNALVPQKYPLAPLTTWR